MLEIYLKDIDTGVIFIVEYQVSESFIDSYMYPDRLVFINEI